MEKEERIDYKDNWELTWPIWHMLPRDERKQLATKYGYKTIGAFEEFMSLASAERDSSSAPQPYPNELIYQDQKPAAVNEEIADDDSQASDSEDDSQAEQATADEFQRAGTMVEQLGDESLLHHVFSYLPVDTYATLAWVSPSWKFFTRTEHVYKKLCERVYLKTSKKKSLHVSRFGSYRNMLCIRPRIKAGGGAYVMKYSRVKKIQRDMWTEIPVGAILETTYYRYLYFQEDGRVLYSLTPHPPHEVFPKLGRRGRGDGSIVWGTYTVQKQTVTVEAQQDWQHVRFVLTICTDQPTLSHGRFGMLSFDVHCTSKSGDFTTDSLFFDPPNEPFRFLKDRRL